MTDEKSVSASNHFLLDEIVPDPLLVLANHPPPVDNKTCIYILDANVLLEPFRLAKKESQDVTTIYRHLASKNRLLVPRRALQEFARNRTNVLRLLYERLHSAHNSAQTPLLPIAPFLLYTKEYQAIAEAKDALEAARKTYLQSVNDLMTSLSSWAWNDPVSIAYKELFTADRIISPQKSNDALLADMKRRFAHGIPPGFKDKGKQDGGIGDIIIWHSILEAAAARQKDVVFVTKDEKADWVVSQNESALCVCPELTYEFCKTTGHSFTISNYADFLQDNNANDDTIEHVRTAVDGLGDMPRSQSDLGVPTLREARISLEELRDVAREGVRLPTHFFTTARLFDFIDRLSHGIDTLDRFLDAYLPHRHFSAAFDNIRMTSETCDRLQRMIVDIITSADPKSHRPAFAELCKQLASDVSRALRALADPS